MMKKGICLYIAVLSCAFALFSCSDEGTEEVVPETTGYELSFDVATRAGEDNEEVLFRSLYIYAYDAADGTADFYRETDVNEASRHSIRMEIQKEGAKRFYVIANPPAYVASQLTETCSEANLQNLVIAMQGVAYTMSDLPQNADGVGDTGGDTGFPMANRMTAYARITDVANRRMALSPTDADTRIITQLPVIRCLGKISVKAYRADSEVATLSVNTLSIYRFVGNGFFMPVWEEDGKPEWKNSTSAGSSYAEWNTGRKLDLTALGEKEEVLITNTVSVLPAVVAVGATGKDAATPVTSFYLCQNSYGEAIDGGEQPGLVDTMGNRTTRLVVGLSDGRSTELLLPYLRRNDHLTIYLKISAHAIQFEFKKWNLVDVTPDWNEE